MEVVIFTGIQGTGKSTFYKDNFFKTHMRINLDMLKTRKREDILLDACIKAKQPFVIDNTNTTAINRKKYIDMAKSAGFMVIGYYFDSNINEAIIRNEGREGKERIPIAAIKKTYAQLEIPSLEEGFDLLYFVRINENRFVVEELNAEIVTNLNL